VFPQEGSQRTASPSNAVEYAHGERASGSEPVLFSNPMMVANPALVGGGDAASPRKEEEEMARRAAAPAQAGPKKLSSIGRLFGNSNGDIGEAGGCGSLKAAAVLSGGTHL